MSGLIGSQVRDPNYRLRFFIIMTAGAVAFGAVLSWKSSILFASEYQDMPVTSQQLKIKKENQQKRLFKYQIEE